MGIEIGRLLTAMVTPFREDGSIDFPEARNLAQALIASGSDGVVVAGTTGESPTLSAEEKIRLFSEVKDALGDTGSVVANTGTYNTEESVELTKRVGQLGVDGVMAVVPYYNKPTQEGLYQHFRAVAKSTELPLILYNVPTRTSTNLSYDTTLKLSRISNIIGIKEASGDLDQISQIIKGAPEGFRVWSGNDNETMFIMALGGFGVISVASHLVGSQIRTMVQAMAEEKLHDATKLHLDLHPLFKVLFIISNPIPVKHAVGMLGFKVGKPRLPLLPPEVSTAKEIDAIVLQYQIDLPVPAKV